MRHNHVDNWKKKKTNQTPRRLSRIVAVSLVDKKSRAILSSVCEVNDLARF